eukprot:532535_1
MFDTPLSSEHIFKHQFEDVQNQVEKCEKKNSTKRQKILSLKKEMFSLQTNLSTTKDELRLALNKNTGLENDLSVVNNQITHAEKSKLELVSDLKNAQKEVQHSHDQLRDERNKALMLEIRHSTSNNNFSERNSLALDTFQKFHNESNGDCKNDKRTKQCS